MHWKSWEYLSKNKNERVMGFKDFNLMNFSYLAKQAWRAIHNPSALWVQILKAIYFPKFDFLHATRKKSDSLVWASLMHGKSVIEKFSRWSIGNGKDVLIEKDRWVGDGKMVRMRDNSEISKVSELMEVSRRCRDVNIIRQNFNSRDAVRILQTPICWTADRDMIFWPTAKSGMFFY